MTNIPALIAASAARWKTCEVLPNRAAEARSVALRLVALAAKTQYQEVEKTTGVPWYVIAVIHEREADQSWMANLAQGDRWDRVSIHVPRGHGPFESWYDAAVDALEKCAPYAARWKDWSIGGQLTILDLYNGTGYEDYHHEPSPYIWGATNIEQIGKYVRDGVYNHSVWDTQLGCAAMLKKMMELDDLIKPEGA